MKKFSDVNFFKGILGLFMLGLLLLSAHSLHAGGLYLTEFGTPDVGLAGAGWAARAQGASTLFRNPAGMALLEGNQFQGGVQLLYGDIGFTSNGNSTPSGGGGRQSGRRVPRSQRVLCASSWR